MPLHVFQISHTESYLLILDGNIGNLWTLSLKVDVISIELQWKKNKKRHKQSLIYVIRSTCTSLTTKAENLTNFAYTKTDNELSCPMDCVHAMSWISIENEA